MPSPEHCLCGSVHVKTGTYIIAVLFTIGGVCGLIVDVGKIGQSTVPVKITTFAWHIFVLIAGVTSLKALKEKNPKMLWPNIFYHYAMIASSAIGIVICFLLAIFLPKSAQSFVNKLKSSGDDQDGKHSSIRIALFVIAAFFAVSIAFNYWTLTVVKNCQTWMKEDMFAEPEGVYVQRDEENENS
ncbi:hypothetical protein L596_022215 [Steinernema carpocapsae]|uniref:Uncharacterized protein n=1 Tax=Steinernema carpocapsae TaxID=34508 RepID=A0A4U5ML52_STECR|nr:hypothetical protein L596_022215 [Steinernema carpocapsae]